MKVLIIMGPCAAGKDTILRWLRQKGVKPLISCTTRPMRKGEHNGREYFFISDKQFHHMENGFIETRDFEAPDGTVWHYGLHNVFNGSEGDGMYAVVVDVGGAKGLLQYYGSDATPVFIDASEMVRKQRALLRDGELGDVWDYRLKNDHEMFSDIDEKFPGITKFRNEEGLDAVAEQVYSYMTQVFSEEKE